MLILYFSQLSIDAGDTFDPSALENRNPVPETLSSIPRCVPVTFDDCWTIAYVPRGDQRVERWIEQVRVASDIPEEEVRGFDSDEVLNQFFVDNPNRTQAAYIFDNDSLNQINDKNIQFIVQYNDTEQSDFPIGTTTFHTQVVVPNMIHAMNLAIMPELAERNIDLTLNYSVFPHPNLIDVSGSGLDAFAAYGPLLMFGTFFLVLVFFLYKIVDEKARGLRDAMKLAGQYQSQHYISWCLPYVVIVILLTLLIIAFGYIFDFAFFTGNDFSISFLTMFIFGLSLIGWTMMVATLTDRAEHVSIVGFNLFIFGYLLASIGNIVYQVEPNGEAVISDGALFLRQLFAIFPCVPFVKALTDGSIQPLIGNRLTFENIDSYTDVFPIRECWIWMICSGLVAFAIAIYLDNVLPSTTGAPLSLFYPFMPRYWGFGRKRSAKLFDNMNSDDEDVTDSDSYLNTEIESYDPNSEDADVRAEREAVARGDRDSAALVIKNISKKFGKLAACDDVSFSVKKNTAFALLGHNGAGKFFFFQTRKDRRAVLKMIPVLMLTILSPSLSVYIGVGKSTLFNMLVTSLRPTEGDAYIFGLSVRHEQAAVRKLLGVCPQFDIYWDKLTGGEHIEIFAALKGLAGAERRNEIDMRLADVHLSEKKDAYAGTYSGGMQRRLSVALSLTGDPKIVLLDECTSGADPLVRRDLWGTIDRAKNGRVIFLITHSIAEAQHIAGHNSIGIMAKGKLRVLGNAMRLKSKFGAGYRLLAILKPEASVEELSNGLNGACRGTVLASVSTGDRGEILAEFSLPRTALESEVLRAVKIIEGKKEEFQVTDYSLNSATLGEVFKSITSLSEDVHEEEDESETKKRCCCF